MTTFPLPLAEILGHWPSYLVYLLIGIGFGYALEVGGFADSRKLAAQFYFKDMTVLKVMFGAIITAMVLIFMASAVGLLDYNLVYVNPTYLWPGIVGGLIMGVGFIVGGFCPGTSLVSAAVLKLDGIFFALGVFFGIFLFGETVSLYEEFWHSSYFGRLTIQDWLNVPTGIVVLGVVLMAVFMFWGSEQLEKKFGKKDLGREPRWRYGAAGTIVVGALAVLVIGQPTTADRWAQIEAGEEARLANREVQIHPAELLDNIHDPTLQVVMLDVRSEVDYNLFHLLDAVHAPIDTLPGMVPDLLEEPSNTLFVVMSNDETAATEAWKFLRAESVPTLYILEGGINNWLAVYGEGELAETAVPASLPDETLKYSFAAAIGSRHPLAAPNPNHYALTYTPKVVLEVKRGPSGGGCG